MLRNHIGQDGSQRAYRATARTWALRVALYATIQRATELLILACGYARRLYGDDGDRIVIDVVSNELASWQEANE